MRPRKPPLLRLPRTEVALSPGDRRLSASLDQALSSLEAALGGRQKLIDVLSRSSNPAIQVLVHSLATNAEYHQKTFAELCAAANITVADLLKGYQQGLKLLAQTLAMMPIAAELPAVAADAMMRARPHEITCGVCQGTGTVTPEPTKKVPNPSPQPCAGCQGTGRLSQIPEFDRQKLALDLGGMLPKKDTLVQVNTDQS